MKALGGSGDAGPMGIPVHSQMIGNRGSEQDPRNSSGNESGGSSGGPPLAATMAALMLMRKVTHQM